MPTAKKTYAKTKRPRLRPSKRGPARWLDDDLLFLYEKGAGKTAAVKVAETRSAGGSLWHDTYDEFKRRRQQESDALTPVIAAAAPGAAPRRRWCRKASIGCRWARLSSWTVKPAPSASPWRGGSRASRSARSGAVIYAASANGGGFRSR